MNRNRFRVPARWLAPIAAVFLVLGALQVQAQAKDKTGEEPANVATTWILWAKPGPRADFEAAIKTHAAWRKQAGDPMHWKIYGPIAGDDLDHYVVRSGDHRWGDFDAESDWVKKAQADATYEAQLGGHVARVEHHFAEVSAEHSYPGPEGEYRYFGVSRIRLHPGTEGQFFAALKTVVAAAKAGKWPRGWTTSNVIGGSNDVLVVWPYTSFADMKRIEPGFASVLGTFMDSEGAARGLLDGLSSTIEFSDYAIYVYRPDLSTPE